MHNARRLSLLKKTQEALPVRGCAFLALLIVGAIVWSFEGGQLDIRAVIAFLSLVFVGYVLAGLGPWEHFRWGGHLADRKRIFKTLRERVQYPLNRVAFEMEGDYEDQLRIWFHGAQHLDEKTFRAEIEWARDVVAALANDYGFRSVIYTYGDGKTKFTDRLKGKSPDSPSRFPDVAGAIAGLKQLTARLDGLTPEVAETRPRVWDAHAVGPLDRCSRCFSSKEERGDVAFCSRCGQIDSDFGPAFVADEDLQKLRCHLHPPEPAVGYCCLCAKAICKTCEEKRGTSYFPPGPLPYCRQCLARSTELEETYLTDIEARHVCGKHPRVGAEYRCRRCNLTLCASCSYFEGRSHAGPYCLPCFRIAFLPVYAHSWTDGHQVPW